MRKLRVGMIGAGFIGPVHIDAVRRMGLAEIVGFSDVDLELARAKAEQFHIPRAYGNYADLIHDPDVDVIHNCTPTNLHMEVNRQAILAGKHIFSEKPLGMSAAESRAMLELLREHPQVIHGVNYNYRMYPLALDMKRRIRRGELGRIHLIHGSFLQDWLLYATDYNWRIEPEISGATRAIGDLGSHWCDLAQTVTGMKIVEVFAEFNIVHPVRRKSTVAETFAKTQAAAEYEEKTVRTEDWAAVLVRFENGAKGVFQAGEISAGRKARLDLEISGLGGTFYWNQEEGDKLWIGQREGANQIAFRDPNGMDADQRRYAFAPAGHPEGWLDSNRNSVAAFYQAVLSGVRPGPGEAEYATFEDGHDIMLVTDAIARSHAEGRWIAVDRSTT